MADIQWKMTATENGQTFHYTRKFSKPRVENGQVVGEYVRTYKQAGNYCTLETNYKYKMVSDSQYSWEILSATCDGKPENGDIGKQEFIISNYPMVVKHFCNGLRVKTVQLQVSGHVNGTYAKQLSV